MITSYYRSLYRAGRYCFADNPLQQRLHEEINGGINDIILQKRQAKAMLKQAMKDSQMQVS